MALCAVSLLRPEAGSSYCGYTHSLSRLHFYYKPNMGTVRAWGSTRGVPLPALWGPFHGGSVLFCLGGLASASQASHLLALPALLIRTCCESDLELPGVDHQGIQVVMN